MDEPDAPSCHLSALPVYATYLFNLILHLSIMLQFFSHYINNINEKELEPKLEVDLDDVSSRVQEAMDSAAKATERLGEIKDEMSSYVDKLQGGKLASK